MSTSKLPALLAVAAACALLAVGAGVWTGATDQFDAALLLALDARRAPAWALETARDLTALGSNGVLGLMIVVLVIDTIIAARMRDAALLAGTFAGGLLLVGLAKSIVARPRPGLLEPAVTVFTTSFPSSHASLSAALATAIVLRLGQHGRPASARWRVCAAIVVCAAIGLSRVALEVHRPTDVLAGWALGLCWGSACWLATRR